MVKFSPSSPGLAPEREENADRANNGHFPLLPVAVLLPPHDTAAQLEHHRRGPIKNAWNTPALFPAAIFRRRNG